jgi:hypothetical protein
MKRIARRIASIAMFCLAMVFVVVGDPIGMIASLLVTAGAWPGSPQEASDA